MSTSRKLKERRDVDNADIPDIIERAESLRLAAEHQREQNANRSTIEDVQKVGRELSIPDIFVEQAIEELQQERRPSDDHQEESFDQETVLEPEASRKKSRLIPTAVMAAVIAFVFTQWFNDTDQGSEQTKGTEPTVVVQERVIKETVIKEVIKEVEIVREVERIVEVPAKENRPKENIPSTETLEEHVDPPPRDVETTETMDDVTIRITEPDPVKKETVETVDDIQEPAVEVSLPKLSKAIEGEWLLDAYLLYEKGVELPMEIPVNFEPLELPKTWRFSKGRYKRVMDSDLSFSAKYRVISLPKELQAVVDEDGQWGQIEASNVVSTIPGIRRQNDYFAIFVSEQAITIWYLGPNAYRKKLPSQAERYIRK